MDNILKHLGGIIKEHTSDVVQEPLPGTHHVKSSPSAQIGAGMIRAERSIRMTRERTVADAAVKKIGQVMRDMATDIVAEELPENIVKLLDRLRQSTPSRGR